MVGGTGLGYAICSVLAFVLFVSVAFVIALVVSIRRERVLGTRIFEVCDGISQFVAERMSEETPKGKKRFFPSFRSRALADSCCAL